VVHSFLALLVIGDPFGSECNEMDLAVPEKSTHTHTHIESRRR